MKMQLQTTPYKVTDDKTMATRLGPNMLSEIMGRYWQRWIQAECEHVADAYRRHLDSIQAGSPLPDPHDRAGFLQSLGFSYLGRVEVLEDHLLVSGKESQMKEMLEDDLGWCMMQLLGLPDTQQHFDYAMLFAFLHDRLSRGSSKERAREDELLRKTLSELSTYHEMLVAVRLTRPQNKSRGLAEERCVEGRKTAARGFLREAAVRDEENKNLGDVGSSAVGPMLRALTVADSGPMNRLEAQGTREKVKTHPEPGSVQPVAESGGLEPMPEAEPDVRASSISATKRLMQIFDSMFPEAAEESTKMVG
ncbi:hypothetical protein GGR52DRAFT_586817 [Hypoxylon sp. FL1284]|nr:hypothetical protein GGR52DRAFT_586817 [Hypoxylon sp. FL1284]